MTKKRQAARRSTSSRTKARRPVKSAKRRKQQSFELTKSSLTIRFKTESELSERLAELATLFGGGVERGALEAVAGLDSCLSVIPASRVVATALSPKSFVPTEKLGETYLTSQERELFRARVVKGVKSAGCQIADTDVPAEEATTHSAVVVALRQNAHV